MKSGLEMLRIENFRSFRELKVEGLGQVNLVTGRNNSGKSTLLEAIQLIASDASLPVLASILRLREEDLGDTEEGSRPFQLESAFPFSGLFFGFPVLKSSLEPILLRSRTSGVDETLRIEVGWSNGRRTADGGVLREVTTGATWLDSEEEPALVVTKGESRRRVIPLGFPLGDSWRRSPYRGRLMRIETQETTKPPCLFLGPHGSERTGNMGEYWDKIALSELEREVVDSLRLIAPEVSAVSMVGGDGVRRSRTAIVRTDRFERPVPLRTFGDGLSRVLGIALSLVNAKGGILLVDEFENGLHYTVQEDVWRTVFRLAKRLDIQVFATTHSWDCIDAFQKAAAEVPEVGALVKLSGKGERIISTVFNEKELAIVTRDHIEVR